MIYKTIDGAATWNNTFLDGGYDLFSVWFLDSQHGYVTGDEGHIIITSNAGATWFETNVGVSNVWLFSVFFPDANVGYVAGADYYEQGVIFKTTNGGNNWTQLSVGVIGQITSMYFTDSNTGFVVGYGGIILKTSDGGTTWTSQSSGVTCNLNSVFFVDANTGYTVGDNGVILKTTNGGGYPLGIKDQPSKTNELKIYPNPSSNLVTIETLSNPTHSQISIMNSNGQEVITHKVNNLKTQIDISRLSSGVYFMRLTNDKTAEVGKIVKQ
jgi:photosystem II stability/assembly factor-like uncharacterized protein